ncbi:hypothetical protein ACFL4O_01515 [bacterium]
MNKFLIRKSVSFVILSIFLLSTSNFSYAQIYNSNVNSLDKYCSITDNYKGTSKNTIYIIEDLHCNKSVQNNIFNIIKTLYSQHHISFIGVEGSFGNIDLSIIKNLPKGYKKKAVKHLFKTGYITGPELFALNHDNVHVFGIEDKNLYEQNFRHLYNSLQYRDIISELTKKVNKKISWAEKFLFNANVRQVLKKKNKFDKNRLSFKLYAEYLINTAIKQNILNNPKQYQELIDYTKKGCSKKHDPLTLLHQKDELEFLLLNNCAVYKDAKDLLYTKWHLNLLNKYVSNKLSKQLQEKLESSIDHFKIIQKDFLNRAMNNNHIEKNTELIKTAYENMRSFYRLADKRNEVMAQNMLNKLLITNYKLQMKEDKLKKGNSLIVASNYNYPTGIIVIGGYHTRGISSILRNKSISYSVIRPHVRSLDHNNTYLTRLHEQARQLGLRYHNPISSIPHLTPCMLALTCAIQKGGISIDCFKKIVETLKTVDISTINQTLNIFSEDPKLKQTIINLTDNLSHYYEGGASSCTLVFSMYYLLLKHLYTKDLFYCRIMDKDEILNIYLRNNKLSGEIIETQKYNKGFAVEGIRKDLHPEFVKSALQNTKWSFEKFDNSKIIVIKPINKPDNNSLSYFAYFHDDYNSIFTEYNTREIYEKEQSAKPPKKPENNPTNKTPEHPQQTEQTNENTDFNSKVKKIFTELMQKKQSEKNTQESPAQKNITGSFDKSPKDPNPSAKTAQAQQHKKRKHKKGRKKKGQGHKKQNKRSAVKSKQSKSKNTGDKEIKDKKALDVKKLFEHIKKNKDTDVLEAVKQNKNILTKYFNGKTALHLLIQLNKLELLRNIVTNEKIKFDLGLETKKPKHNLIDTAIFMPKISDKETLEMLKFLYKNCCDKYKKNKLYSKESRLKACKPFIHCTLTYKLECLKWLYEQSSSLNDLLKDKKLKTTKLIMPFLLNGDKNTVLWLLERMIKREDFCKHIDRHKLLQYALSNKTLSSKDKKIMEYALISLIKKEKYLIEKFLTNLDHNKKEYKKIMNILKNLDYNLYRKIIINRSPIVKALEKKGIDYHGNKKHLGIKFAGSSKLNINDDFVYAMHKIYEIYKLRYKKNHELNFQKLINAFLITKDTLVISKQSKYVIINLIDIIPNLTSLIQIEQNKSFTKDEISVIKWSHLRIFMGIKEIMYTLRDSAKKDSLHTQILNVFPNILNTLQSTDTGNFTFIKYLINQEDINILEKTNKNLFLLLKELDKCKIGLHRAKNHLTYIPKTLKKHFNSLLAKNIFVILQINYFENGTVFVKIVNKLAPPIVRYPNHCLRPLQKGTFRIIYSLPNYTKFMQIIDLTTFKTKEMYILEPPSSNIKFKNDLIFNLYNNLIKILWKIQPKIQIPKHAEHAENILEKIFELTKPEINEPVNIKMFDKIGSAV